MILPTPLRAGPALFLVLVFILFTSLANLSVSAQSYNGLAVTPAMGWDNWNAFGCEVSADLILGTAQKMVDLGLRDLGYDYVIIDDCWSKGRYSNGSLKPDFDKFPNGMKDVGDRLHAMGLKFGMYSSAGFLTCGRYDASLGKEDTDARSFASWGVDYLKYDNCYNGGQAGTQKLSYDRYNAMSMALNNTGRPILYSLCNWGEDSPWNWAQTMSNSWRMSGDIYDYFSRPDDRCPCTGDEPGQMCILPGFRCSVMNILNKQAHIVSKTQSGAQSDLDMLEVGNGGMNDDEYVTHFSMWALVSSPLIMGTDVRKLDARAFSIYANPAVIAVNQDPMTISGARVMRQSVDDKDEYGVGEISAWARPMNNSDVVVALVNGGNSSRRMDVSLAEVFVDQGGAKSKEAMMGYDVYDLWAFRMDDSMSQMVLNGSAGPVAANDTSRWNVSRTSYADGLAANATALMGKKVGSVDPLGKVSAMVARHGTALLRMRPTGMGMSKRDEL